MLAGPSGPVT